MNSTSLKLRRTGRRTRKQMLIIPFVIMLATTLVPMKRPGTELTSKRSTKKPLADISNLDARIKNAVAKEFATVNTLPSSVSLPQSPSYMFTANMIEQLSNPCTVDRAQDKNQLMFDMEAWIES